MRSYPLTLSKILISFIVFFFQAEDGIRDVAVTGVQTCALPILPRSNYDLCRHIKEYLVAEAGDGDLVGCGSLKIYSRDLAEVAGLAVRAEQQGAGVGRVLMEALVGEARASGIAEVLALTRKPPFFPKLGFELAEKEHFHLKVWADCAKCPRQNCCDEIAVVLKFYGVSPLTPSCRPRDLSRFQGRVHGQGQLL